MDQTTNASGNASSAAHCKSVIFEVLQPLATEKGLELEDRLDVSIPQNILPEVQTLADLVRELEGLTES